MLLQGCQSLQASPWQKAREQPLPLWLLTICLASSAACCDAESWLYARAAILPVTVNATVELSWLSEAAGVAVGTLQSTAVGWLMSHHAVDYKLQQPCLPVASLLLAEHEQLCLLPRLHLNVCAALHRCNVIQLAGSRAGFGPHDRNKSPGLMQPTRLVAQ